MVTPYPLELPEVSLTERVDSFLENSELILEFPVFLLKFIREDDLEQLYSQEITNTPHSLTFAELAEELAVREFPNERDQGIIAEASLCNTAADFRRDIWTYYKAQKFMQIANEISRNEALTLSIMTEAVLSLILFPNFPYSEIKDLRMRKDIMIAIMDKYRQVEQRRHQK